MVFQHEVLVLFEPHGFQLLQIVKVESVGPLLEEGNLINCLFVHELDQFYLQVGGEDLQDVRDVKFGLGLDCNLVVLKVGFELFDQLLRNRIF